MKKVISLLLITMLAICSLGLIACEYGSIKPAHNFSRKVGVVEATCTTKGYTTYACTDEGCDAVKMEDIPELGHDYVLIEDVAPTCTEKGRKTYNCSRKNCTNNVRVEEIPALNEAEGHILEHFDGLSATCTEDGYDAYDVCNRENCNYTSFKAVPATGHDINENRYCAQCDTTFDPIETTLSTGLVVYNSLYFGDDIKFSGGKVVETQGGEQIKGTWALDEEVDRLLSTDNSTSLIATVTATFTPNSYLYEKITTEVSLTFKVVAKYDGKYYITLDGALTAANEKNSGTVTVLPNGDYYDKLTANTITIDEIKSGVTLSMPWATESQSVSGYSASSKASVNDVRVLGLVDGDGLDHAFKNQTNYLISVVIVGSNLVNNGTINIGGVVSGNQGDEVTSQTAKEHTKLDLAENVTLTNNGKINCYGYIDESKDDTATLVNNGTIETPFSIGEHRGGSYFVGYKDSLDRSFTATNGGASPFNRFFCLNIFAKTIHNPNSKVNGLVDLYANSSHNDSTITLIATNNSSSLINLASNTVLETKVNRGTLVNTMDFYGSFTLNALTVSIQYMGTQTMSTSKVLLPISWYFNVNMHKFKDGSESAVKLYQDIKLLPGAKMVIDSGVTVTANYITIYEIYPTSKSDLAAGAYFKLGSEFVQYEKAYYNIPAELVVNGTLNVNTIGGTVKTTEDGAILNVKSGVSAKIREVNKIEDGTYTYIFKKIACTNPVFAESNISLKLPTLVNNQITYTTATVGEYVSSNGAFALKTAE